MRKAIALLVVVFLTAIASSLCRAGENTPTIDLSNGHEYALLQKGGVTIQKSTYITSGGGRSSDTILDQSVAINVGSGKSFTMQASAMQASAMPASAMPASRIKFVFPAGMVGIGRDDSFIQFLALETICPTEDGVKAKIKEIGGALGFKDNEFDQALDSGGLAKETRWAKGNEDGPLYWAVQVDSPSVPSSGYTVWVYIAWDKALIARLCPEAIAFRQVLNQVPK